MADCKQCLHYEICEYVSILGKTCKGFKDRTKWVKKKIAKWIPINTIDKWRYQCDCCKHYVDAGTDRNYCPNCGCEMVK